MPNDKAPTSRTLRRERALTAARRRLRLLEIETHRIKAELARLEAENEDDIADELTGELDGETRPAAAGRIRQLEDSGRSSSKSDSPLDSRFRSGAAVSLVDSALETRSLTADRTARIRHRANRPTQVAPEFAIDTAPKDSATPASRAALAKKARRRTMPAAWSLGVHAAVLAMFLMWTFPVLVNDDVPLMASPVDLSAEPPEVAEEVPIEIVAEEDFDLQGMPLEESTLDLADSLTNDLVPLQDTAAAELASTVGQIDSLPSDLGTLMVGAGSDGKGRGGGSRGRGRLRGANFFGAEAIGDRFVFLVDNSGSMKKGRMETTMMELLKSVSAMSKEQSFYVIFYSDQAYPMFYPHGVDKPVAATPENKEKLFNWLRTVELCIGGELVDAIELAASLKPDSVYILSDGDISSTRTMQRLTEPNDWEFKIHTLGMGTSKPNHAANLAAIANAHGGSFRIVQPSPAAVQMARQRPIRSNPSGVAWGMGLPQP